MKNTSLRVPLALATFATMGTLAAGCSGRLDVGDEAPVGPRSSDGGEQASPIAVLHGTVTTTTQATATPGATAAILWLTATGDRGLSAASPPQRNYTYRLAGFSTPVSAAFPAAFELQIQKLPPPEALLGFGPQTPVADSEDCSYEHPCDLNPRPPVDNTQPREVAVGYIVALAPRADLTAVAPGDIVGASLDAVILFNAHDLAPASDAAKFVAYYGGDTSAGYHLVHAKVPNDQQKRAFWTAMEGSVCGHQVPLPSEVSLWEPWFLASLEYSYQECMRLVDQPSTCVQTIRFDESIPLPEPYDTATLDCDLAIGKSMLAHGGQVPPVAPAASITQMSSAPLSTPITITLGAKPWEIDQYMR